MARPVVLERMCAAAGAARTDCASDLPFLLLDCNSYVSGEPRSSGCSYDEAHLSAGGTPDELASELAELDAFEADVQAKRGAGLVAEMTGPNDGFYPEGLSFDAASLSAGALTRTVVVLADRFTGEAAEWLVRAAREAGFATVVGRATLGSLDNTCPRVVRLDEDYALIIPTATYVAARESMATLGHGIAPDVHVAWTPEHLTRDVDLEVACERARAETQG
ncbi:MAG: hypothetical protein KHY83_00630 [Coriobacteriia bacterium]|nr:hypothetical protein [Coriobacteriia bacterium]